MNPSQGIISKRNSFLLLYTVLFVIVGVYFAFSGGGYYTHGSLQKLDDLIKIKIWLIISFVMAVAVYYSDSDRGRKQWYWLLVTAVYFVVFYALLFKGTDYGMNGHWGDNGNRLALVTKFREFWSPFQDWYYKGLPSFYPPLWLYLQGKLAWLFGIEGYASIKAGYFVIYAFYPLALFYVWSKVSSRSVAFAIAFITLFLRDLHLDYVYYEHITAAFFVPWWLCFVEDVRNRKKKGVGLYALGGFLGALIFMTYYFWFFAGILSMVIRPVLQLILGRRKFLETSPFRTKFLMLAAVGIFSSIYWLPLLISIIQYGADSMQNKWFHQSYLDLKLPFFDYTPAAVVYLLGLIYLAARYKKQLIGRYLIFLLCLPALFFIDCAFALFDISIQSRKVIELLPVFLSVPAGFGVVCMYRYLSRRSEVSRRVAVVLIAFLVLFVGNSHSDIISQKMWKVGMNSRVPSSDLDVYRSVDYEGRVFLTNQYLEASYSPFYFFQCHWGPSAHTAARYEQRNAFLKYVGILDDAKQAAFLFRNNRFDAVDFFYLPVDQASGKAYYETSSLNFPAKTEKLRIEFARETTIESPYFKLKHERGLYSIENPGGSVEDILNVRYDYDDLGGLIKEYNRINLAIRFLSDSSAAPLCPARDSLRNIIADSLQIETGVSLDRGVFISDFKIVSASNEVPHLMLLTGTEKRLRENFYIFIHAYPEDIECLDADRRQYGFANLDYYPDRRTSDWIVGEHILIEKEIKLRPGRYKFHVGLFNKASGTLRKSYTSQYFTIY